MGKLSGLNEGDAITADVSDDRAEVGDEETAVAPPVIDGDEEVDDEEGAEVTVVEVPAPPVAEGAPVWWCCGGRPPNPGGQKAEADGRLTAGAVPGTPRVAVRSSGENGRGPMTKGLAGLEVVFTWVKGGGPTIADGLLLPPLILLLLFCCCCPGVDERAGEKSN